MTCLDESGFDCSSLGCNLLCNGYSLSCKENVGRTNVLNDSSTREIGEWSLSQLNLKFERYNQSETTVHIDMFETGTPSSDTVQKSVFSLVLHLLRCGDATFPKRFRPGVYKYNGKASDDCKDKENKLGTWVRSVFFFFVFVLWLSFFGDFDLM